MAKISGSVGDGGLNARHDVALIRLMLSVVKDSKGAAYLSGAYDGGYLPAVGAAIAAFQADNAPAKGTPGVTPEKSGLMVPNGETLARLSAALPVSLKGVRTTAGISVVYLDMGADARRASLDALKHPDNKLDTDFAAKLSNLVNDFYDQAGIVLTVQEPFGWWRSFDMQVGLASQGGPGETIHNYGRAVDMAFKGLKWVTPQGRIQATPRGDLTHDPVLKTSVQDEFWTARFKAVQQQPGLFATTAFGGGDKAHLQDLEDGSLDSVGSFIGLMESVGPGKMKWEPFEMTPTKYLCDFGLGGAKYLVGTALDIWVNDPADKRWAKTLQEKGLKPELKLTKVDLVTALNAKIKADPTYSFDRFLGAAAGTHKKGELTPNDVSDIDLKTVHLIIRREFEAAASNWKKWKPVRYPDDTRRPKAKSPSPPARASSARRRHAGAGEVALRAAGVGRAQEQ